MARDKKTVMLQIVLISSLEDNMRIGYRRTCFSGWPVCQWWRIACLVTIAVCLPMARYFPKFLHEINVV